MPAPSRTNSRRSPALPFSVRASSFLLFAAFTTDAGLVQGDENAITIQTVNGHFLTAVNGGGVGGPNSGPDSAAIHTDASYPSPGPWERFRLVRLEGGKCALQTKTGFWLTAVNGGGWGEAANRFPIHTDARRVGPWETFAINPR